MLLEYNQEISDALSNTLGGNVENKRHLGIRIMKRSSDGKAELVWASGFVEWGEDSSGSCSKYNSWTSANWDALDTLKYTAYLEGNGVSLGMKPGI